MWYKERQQAGLPVGVVDEGRAAGGRLVPGDRQAVVLHQVDGVQDVEEELEEGGAEDEERRRPPAVLLGKGGGLQILEQAHPLLTQVVKDIFNK